MSKKLILLLLAISIGSVAQAQNESNPSKTQEVGVSFSNLNNFGFIYRVGQSTNLWRYGTNFISGSSSSDEDPTVNDKSSSFGFGIEVGKEFRRPVTEKLDFRHGINLNLGYDQYSDPGENPGQSDVKRQSFSPRVSYILGVNYSIAENVYLGAEILPGIGYTSTKDTFTNTTTGDEDVYTENTLTYGFSNGSARLSLVYRF